MTNGSSVIFIRNEIDCRMMQTLLLTLFSIGTLSSIIIFLVKQSIWTRFILPFVSRRSRPYIAFENGSSEMNVEPTEAIDIDKEVGRLMAEEEAKYPKKEIIDSYKNPWGLQSGDPAYIKNYNKQLEYYYQSKRKQTCNQVVEEAEKQQLIPIKLVVNNEGNAPTGLCDITIAFSLPQHVYLDEAFERVSDTVLPPPIYSPNNPLLDICRFTGYEYKRLNTQRHVAEKLVYRMEVLNHHAHNNRIFPTFYVDARKVNTLTISWQIIDASLSAPIKGELQINFA